MIIRIILGINDEPSLTFFLTTMNLWISKWISEGKIKWNETVYEGLENAPKAFIALFEGKNTGKMLVKIGSDRAI